MTIVEFSVPTLQSLTSTCNAVVVFCTGLALLSAKSSMQVTTIGISSVTFCFQRLLFMIIIDVRVPQLSCDVFATISYVLQVAMRLSVIAGLYFRASAANRQLKLMLLDIAIDFSAFAGLLSVSLLVFMGSTTPFIAPEYCLQDMNHLQVLLNNILFVFSAASLTYLMAYPISKTLAISATKHAQQILARYGGRINPAAIPQSKTYTQARVMLKVVRFVPTFLLAVLLIVLLGSDLTNRTLLFLGSLIITDFAGVVLLLFPIIVMSGDNGDGVAGRVKFPKLKNRHASMGSRSVLGSPIEDGTELKSENAVTNLDTLGRQDSVVMTVPAAPYPLNSRGRPTPYKDASLEERLSKLERAMEMEKDELKKENQQLKQQVAQLMEDQRKLWRLVPKPRDPTMDKAQAEELLRNLSGPSASGPPGAGASLAGLDQQLQNAA
eukprot:jgi/Hompol1/3920/HPOL_000717-RA